MRHDVLDPTSRQIRAASAASQARARFLLTATFLIWASLFATCFREITATDALITVGGYTLTTAEPVILALIVVVAHGFLLHKVKWGWIGAGALIFSAAVVIALLRGFLADPLAALFAGRVLVAIPMFALVGLVAQRDSELTRRSAVAVKATGAGLSVVVFSRVMTGFPAGGPLEFDGRPLLNYGALLIAMGATLFLSDGLRRWDMRQVLAAATLLIACLVSGQGTASAVALVGLLIVFVRERGRYLVERWYLGAVVTFAFTVIAFAVSDWLSAFVGGELVSSYIEARSGTNIARQEVWRELIREYSARSAAEQILGLPIGEKRLLYVDLWGGTYWEHSLHSMYFQVLSSFGALGLAGYVLMLLGALRIHYTSTPGSFCPPDSRPISAAAGLAFLVMIAMFGYSYDLRSETSLVIMLMVVAALNTARGAPRRPSRHHARSEGLASRDGLIGRERGKIT